MRRWLRAAAMTLGIMGLTAAACQPSATTYAGPTFAALDPSLAAAFVTWEGSDTYSLTAGTDEGGEPTVTATAPAANRGSNTRAVFWRVADQAHSDQQSCMAWDHVNGSNQPGIALRVRYSGGHTQAITVTQNIWFAANWVFNVHVMDSSQSSPFRQIGAFDMSRVLRPDDRTLPLPWSLCARVVRGTVSFKVWPSSEAEPAWDDPSYGGSVTLPAAWASTRGRAGWYVGHLDPGKSIRFSALTVAGIGAIVTRPTEPTPAVPMSTTTSSTSTSSTTTIDHTTSSTSSTTSTTPTADTTTLPEEPTTPPEDPTDIPSGP